MKQNLSHDNNFDKIIQQLEEFHFHSNGFSNSVKVNCFSLLYFVAGGFFEVYYLFYIILL